MDYSNKVILYNKYLSILGGGELHALKLYEAICKHFSKQGVILSAEKVTSKDIKNKFQISLENTVFEEIPNLPDIPEKFKNCDIFINATDRSLIKGIGKKNILLVYFPVKSSNYFVITNPFSRLLTEIFKIVPIKLFSLGANFLASYKSLKGLNSYDLILANSKFTQNWIKRYWGRESEILYPPVNVKEFANTSEKENKILGIGRFFKANIFIKSHNKRQDILIKAFKKLIDENKEDKTIQNAQLHLVGSIGPHQSDKKYFEQLKKDSNGYPIFFHISPSFEKLKQLYATSKIFWHATGYGVDEEEYPQQMEHFGITTVEAMSAGCIPIVINKGGQKETVSDGENGFLWDSVEELVNKTAEIIKSDLNQKELQSQAIKSAQKYSVEKFESRVVKLLQSKNL